MHTHKRVVTHDLAKKVDLNHVEISEMYLKQDDNCDSITYTKLETLRVKYEQTPNANIELNEYT